MICDVCHKEIGQCEDYFTEDELLRCEKCYMKSLDYYECNCGEFFKHDIITHACQECWSWEDIVYNDLCRNGKVGRYDYGYEHERQVREALSNLNKQGHITFPKYPNEYHLVQADDMEDLEKYLDRITQTLATTYFNRILPYRHVIKEERLKRLMGGLHDVFSDDSI